jgi:hypothetical protein
MVKINRTGPGGPLGPTGDSPDLDRADNVQKTGGKGFADKLDKSAATGSVAPTSGQGPVAGAQLGKASLVADIAADLKAGKISPEVAVDRAMARVLDSHVGPDAPAGLRTRVEDALKEAVASDPVLLGKIESLRS